MMTMTAEEIRKQWEADEQWIYSVVRHKVHEEWRRNLAKLKNDKWPFMSYFHRTNPANGNEYVVSIVFTSKSDWQHNYYLQYAMAITKDEKGRICGIMLQHGLNEIIIYTNHFLKRYAERRHKVDIITPEQYHLMMAHYCSRNTEGGNLIETIYKHHRTNERAVYEGLELLTRDSQRGINIAQTFLVPSQLYARQMSDAELGAMAAVGLKKIYRDRTTFTEAMKAIERDNNPQVQQFGDLKMKTKKAIAIYSINNLTNLMKK